MGASKAELWTQLSEAIKISDELLKFGNANTPNFVSMLDTLTQAFEGNHVAATASALNSFRGSLVSLVNQTGHLTPLILELAKVGYSSKAKDVQAALNDIFDGMYSLSETVKNRSWTYGTVAIGGSNVGTGILYRLVYDEIAELIEAGLGGNLKAQITVDKNTGASAGSEICYLHGDGIPPTDVLEPGSVPGTFVNLVATQNEDGQLNNSSFESYTGTGATLAFDSWTLGDATKALANTSIIFRPAPGLTTGTSLELTDNNTATQYILDAAKSSIDLTKPVFLIVRYRRKTSCDGTLTISLGSKTNAVTLSTKTDATWYDLAVGDADEKGWYDNFKEDSSSKGFRVILTLSGRTTGSLLIDNVILAQPTQYDGKWYLLTAGQTDFLNGDYWTYTDSVANTGRIQFTLNRLFGKYLPHTSGTPTYPDA